MLWPDPIINQKEIIMTIGKVQEVYDIASIGEKKITDSENEAVYNVKIVPKIYGKQIIIEENSINSM